MPPSEPFLYVFMGLIASGKSTLANLWAARQHIAYFNSDMVRKELAGQPARTMGDFGAGIYTPEFSRRTYDELLRRAANELSQGKAVVLDGSYHRLEERQIVSDYCGAQGFDYCFILCFCAQAETRRRLALRAQDPHAVSDGTWDIFVRQEQLFEYPAELKSQHFLTLETSHPPDQLVEELRERLG